jgi:hypothetical protein
LDRVAEKTTPLINGTLYGLAEHPQAARGVGRAAPRPKPAAPPAWQVEMISGNQQQVVKFTVPVANSGDHQ